MKTIVYPINNGNYVDSHIPLIMSLRSLEKYMTDPFRVFIISEKMPQYLSEEVFFIKCDGYRDAMEIATTLDEEFLWMNDDIIFLNDTSWDDLRVWRRSDQQLPFSRINEILKNGSNWAKKKAEILKRLRENGQTSYDFSTHSPYLYNSELLRKVMVDYDFGYKTPVECAYGNVADIEHAPNSRFLSRHHSSFLPVDCSSYDILNFDDTGLTDHMVGFLLGRFSKPSKFEDYGGLDVSKTLISKIH